MKNILHNEVNTRLFLFYGNRDKENIAFVDELSDLQAQYPDRLHSFFFFQRESSKSNVSRKTGCKKVSLIINQILDQDEEDEESTIWDATDEVRSWSSEMIKSIANACYHHGIRKQNIHFELLMSLMKIYMK